MDQYSSLHAAGALRALHALHALRALRALHVSFLRTQVYTSGFSQESMFAGYTAICFPDKVAGVWQGGSGLAKTGFTPVVPGRQAQCSRSEMAAKGGDCCKKEDSFCKTCQYWPAWPRTHPKGKIIDCLMAYTHDPVGCGSDWSSTA